MEKKKIIYIANARIPTEKAHGFQMMKMCESFADEGYVVLMIAPRRKNKIKKDAFDFYGVKRNFQIKYIYSPDFVRFGPVGFLISTWFFSVHAVSQLFKTKKDFIYSRDGRSLWLLSWFSNNFGWEVHDDERKWWAKRIMKRGLGIVTTNRALADLHIKFINQHLRNLVARNGAIQVQKNVVSSIPSAFIKNNRKKILYTGHLYDYKGARVLAEAAIQLPQYDFYFIGGTQDHVSKFKEEYSAKKNVNIVGHIPHGEIVNYLKAADLLILPNSSKDKFSALYTSPIKLFEYIASGTPVVASELPSIIEIVSSREVFFFEPDKVESLVEAITLAITNYTEAQNRATAAQELSKQFTWGARARSIINFFSL